MASGENTTPALEIADLWDRSNPRSVLNLVPQSVASSAILASTKQPELFQMDERTLYRHLRGEGRTPTPTDNRLRINFWLEYDRAQAEGRDMEMISVYAGICSKVMFEQKYTKSAEKCAWILCPPAAYTTVAEEALQFGLEQLREVLELDHAPGGKVNVRLIEIKAKIVAMLDMRLKGGITQKIEQKNMNLNVTTSDKSVAKVALAGTMEDLEKRLKDIERRERRALNLPVENERKDTIDVTAEVTDPS